MVERKGVDGWVWSMKVQDASGRVALVNGLNGEQFTTGF